MPPTLFDRIPFATLQNFVLFSFVGFGSCIFFAWSHAKDYMIESMNSTKNFTELEYNLIFNSLTFSQYTRYLIMAVTSQFWTILTLINMCCCILALIGKGIQLIVFGTLRVSELQQLRERFWNFVFYKFIFIFGILNVQYMSDALMWTAWFTLLCSLQMLAQLCKYRFEYLSCSPATPKAHHIKLISLLTIILLLSFCLIAASITTAIHTDWNIFFFMVAECLLLTVKTSYVLTKSWLAQDISCPTCRVSLSEQKTRNLTEDEEVIRQMDDNNDAMVRHRDRPVRQDDEGIQNHFFEFDATQYVSWLPRFSVAVTRLTGRQPVQLNSMTNGSDDSSEYESDSEENVESVTEEANPTPVHTETGNSNPQLHTNTPYEDYPASSATDIQDNQELFPEDPNDRHQLLQGRKSEMQNVGLLRYYAQNRNEASSSHASNAAETEDNKSK
ncbi:hypothetical protein EB796_010177 [Bugula neritina]|uniref:E3 ubiquitin-protein ligase synoviolin-like TPR repeats domain-containing protein n=1 Tax=Bugula neritina TaxID=10212 RepID=A0A7J7K046_BUGNE|nr:hypothetical protein EB796_010177 [Bugula neritina]